MKCPHCDNSKYEHLFILSNSIIMERVLKNSCSTAYLNMTKEEKIKTYRVYGCALCNKLFMA